MNIVWYRIKSQVMHVAKALVAIVTPIVTTALTNILLDLSTQVQAAIVAAVTGALVWRVPNKAKP